MIYFHSNDEIIYLTKGGVEKLCKIIKKSGGWFKKKSCKLEEVSNCYYNDD